MWVKLLFHFHSSYWQVYPFPKLLNSGHASEWYSICTLLNRTKRFYSNVFLSQNPFSSESLFLFSLQYEFNLLNIILKFALLSWQVPRSSVGRALYRESGPSQDGDPDPGNLPFFIIFFFDICSMSCPFPILYQTYK